MKKHVFDERQLPEAYELVVKEYIPEVRSTSYLLSHKKTKARVLLMDNEDDNKVFYIGFRTPPVNSTGVAHITEHSVLCGSDKYPCKDPFVELVKGSLNTFLNAMTYPDKTIYPIASTNDKDYANLMDVYMDAVLHPQIYHNPLFFKQEGWRYELESLDAPLIYNGVVYNEMKGVYSQPEDVLHEKVGEALFEGTPYAVDSGGDPDVIPELTYEDFLAFHKTYYHPSNSYIYLYGDVDFVERLTFLDTEYLSKYDYLSVNSALPLAKEMEAPVTKEDFYGITPEDSEEKNTFISWSRRKGQTTDELTVTAMQILSYVLLNKQGAPLRQAVLDAGIGEDAYGGFSAEQREPYFELIVRKAEKDDAARLNEVIKDTLTGMVEKGLNKKTILAAINYMEFKNREADYGRFPKGLLYGIGILETWLHEDRQVTSRLCYDKIYQTLRDKVNTSYYEDLIREYLIDNKNGATVLLVPKKGFLEEKEAALAKLLAEKKASLSEEELTKLVEDTRTMKIFQDTPSSKEELEKIPLLSVSDVEKKVKPYTTQEISLPGAKGLFHEVFTNQIVYAALSFDAFSLPVSDVKWLALLRDVLTNVSTKNRKYEDLQDEILEKTGGISFELSGYSDMASSGSLKVFFECFVKCLKSQLSATRELLVDILTATEFTDQKRLKDFIAQIKNNLFFTLQGRADRTAIRRAQSHTAQYFAMEEARDGLSYFWFIEELDRDFDNRFEEIRDNLTRVYQTIINKKTLLCDVGCDRDSMEAFRSVSAALLSALPEKEVTLTPWHFTLEKKNEGIKMASQVNFSAKTSSLPLDRFPVKGSLQVLRNWLNYEYLWINIRVKGGAYGCGAGFDTMGAVNYTTYRDPKLAESYEVFKGIPQAVGELTISDRDLTKYILGAINEMDTPLTPSGEVQRSYTAYRRNITEKDTQKIRDEVLSTTLSELQSLSDRLLAAAEDSVICTVGSATQIEENKDLFDEVLQLAHS